MEESWTGLCEVVQKCGPVNYKTRKEGRKRKGKVVHTNTIKRFSERFE